MRKLHRVRRVTNNAGWALAGGMITYLLLIAMMGTLTGK